MSEELKPEGFVVSPELQAALDSTLAAIKDRPSSKRNPFGRMINCQICGLRHREVGQTAYAPGKHGKIEQLTTKCVQSFTNRIGDFELLREVENEEGEVTLVPDYRTFGQDGERPTMKQVMGSKSVSGKRIKQHPSKMKLLFIERTREAFKDLGFSIDTDKETFSKNLQAAREEAASWIRADHKASKSLKRFAREHSRRINIGLENPGSRYRNVDRTQLYKAERITK